MSLINLTRRAAVIVQRGRFCATPIVRGKKSVDEKETSEEEKYAAKHDYELLLKWANQQEKKMEIKTEEEVKKQIQTHAKKSDNEITNLKNEVEELKSMFAKALESKK